MRAIRRIDGLTSLRSVSNRSCKIIKQRANCVVNITTGGTANMSIEERLRAGVGLAASVGSMESLREVGRYFRSQEFALSL
jgi:hypothetical protein